MDDKIRKIQNLLNKLPSKIKCLEQDSFYKVLDQLNSRELNFRSEMIDQILAVLQSRYHKFDRNTSDKLTINFK